MNPIVWLSLSLSILIQILGHFLYFYFRRGLYGWSDEFYEQIGHFRSDHIYDLDLSSQRVNKEYSYLLSVPASYCELSSLLKRYVPDDSTGSVASCFFSVAFSWLIPFALTYLYSLADFRRILFLYMSVSFVVLVLSLIFFRKFKPYTPDPKLYDLEDRYDMSYYCRPGCLHDELVTYFENNQSAIVSEYRSAGLDLKYTEYFDLYIMVRRLPYFRSALHHYAELHLAARYIPLVQCLIYVLLALLLLFF